MSSVNKKSPKQTRSKAVVKSILDAAENILLVQGMTKLTTNHVAQKAGVNIASLYQYFPNKDAIVATLIEQHVEEEVTRISRVIKTLSENPSIKGEELLNQSNIRLIIKEFIDIHKENLELTKILHMQVSHIACRRVLRDATHFFTKILKNMLDAGAQSDNKNNDTRAFIIANTIDSLIQTTLLEQPDLFVKTIFLDELVALTMGYLNRN